MANIFGRQVVLPLTNKSGGSVAAGDVVIIDTSNDEAFTTTTSGGALTVAGVAQETIANNASGRVLTQGYAALVNVNASVTRGNFGKTHTAVKQATDAGSSRVAGTFCRFLKGGTSPSAWLYPVDQSSPAGTAGTSLLLTYNLASDISNQAITAATAYDMIANQNFTVAGTGSIIEVNVRGFAFLNSTATNQVMTRININSGGTPIIHYFGGGNNTNGTANTRPNILAGGSVFISGLTAATHTIKVQVVSTGNDNLYCRASTNGPTTGAEFLTVQVVEHKQ